MILNCLAIGRTQMMFSATIDIEEIYKIFPSLIETLNVVRNLFAAGELPVVRVNLVLHPAKIFDSFTFARIETLDEGFALLLRAVLASLSLRDVRRDGDKRSCWHDG